MPDSFSLNRFIDAQDRSHATALAELRAGKKRTHWIWYIFPQLKELGHSDTAKFYGIVSLAEAEAYLVHTVLGERLEQATRAAMDSGAASLHDLFGSPDDMKFRSCMTLFSQAMGNHPNLFDRALECWCHGEPDDKTLRLLREG